MPSGPPARRARQTPSRDNGIDCRTDLSVWTPGSRVGLKRRQAPAACEAQLIRKCRYDSSPAISATMGRLHHGYRLSHRCYLQPMADRNEREQESR